MAIVGRNRMVTDLARVGQYLALLSSYSGLQ